MYPDHLNDNIYICHRNLQTHRHFHACTRARAHTHTHTGSSILNSSHLEQSIKALFLDCSTIPSLFPQSTTQLQQVFSIGAVLTNTLLQSVTRDSSSMHSTSTSALARHTTLIYCNFVMHCNVMWGLSRCCYAPQCYVGTILMLLCTTLCGDYLDVIMHHTVMWEVP